MYTADPFIPPDYNRGGMVELSGGSLVLSARERARARKRERTRHGGRPWSGPVSFDNRLSALNRVTQGPVSGREARAYKDWTDAFCGYVHVYVHEHVHVLIQP